jgi:orotidine-5'-phosphate decarboxylase
MEHGRKSLCVALDGTDAGWIADLARRLAASAGWLKVGLEAFTAHGPDLVRRVAATGADVFLDLKLHDIPATVERAAANCARSGARLFNVHAGGGIDMMRAAVAGARGVATGDGGSPRVVAVTVLTSLDRQALEALGIAREPHELVLRWAEMARESGLDGVVASAREAKAIRAACGPDFLIVTPGIRPSGTASDDQRRVVTPAMAIADGADLLVVGRPITRAHDPEASARVIAAEIVAAVGTAPPER